ncbi:hypothetical protein BH09PLA1_BH09PLA1_36390 [soil metagenome]
MQTASKSRQDAHSRARVVALLAGAVLLISAIVTSVSFAKPGIVKTKSGAIYSGDVVERGNSVIVTIRGVETKLAKSDIESIEYQTGSVLEQIETRRSKLAADDVKGRIELARLALENQLYDPALELALEAVKLDPQNEDAISLRETIRRQRQADRDRAKAAAVATPDTTPSEEPGAATAPSTSPATRAAVERKLLTAEDIQQIRRRELKPGDSVRVQIPQDVRRNYASRAGIPFGEFNAKPPIEQALAILENGDDAMRSQVKIMSDPDALIEFKRLQPMILTGCATSNCHGGASAGNLMLNPADNEPATYTNFFILTQYSKNVGDTGDQGIFGGVAERKLVERGHGEVSLLAQYGLPPAKATYKHPKVPKGPGLNPMFRDIEEPRFKKLVDWMNYSLNRIEPDYHIDFKVPRAPKVPPSTAPTTAPTAAPSTPPVAPRPAGTKPAR